MIAALILERADAHDGQDLSHIEAVSTEVRRNGDAVVVTLDLANQRETPISLVGVYSRLGPVAFDASVVVGPVTQKTVDLWIETAHLPGIFTLVLDFGEAGAGPVVIIPDQTSRE